MSAFLEPDDVKRLTGYVRASAQIAWCRNNGVQAWLSAAGEVIIPTSAVHGRPAQNDASWSPDYTALRRD